MKVQSESEVAQLCPTLSNPMDRSLPGSSVHGISHSINIKFILKCQKTQFNFSKISITWDAGSLEKHKLVTKTPRDKWQVAEVPNFCTFSRMKPFPYVYCKEEYCCMSGSIILLEGLMVRGYEHIIITETFTKFLHKKIKKITSLNTCCRSQWRTLCYTLYIIKYIITVL